MTLKAKREYDSAIIDYKKALKIYSEDYKGSYHVDVPLDLVKSLYALASKKSRTALMKQLKSDWNSAIPKNKTWVKEYFKKGDLIVFHEVSNIAIKRAKEFVFGFGKQVVRFSFPYIKSQRFYGGKTGIEVPGKPFTKGEIAQDMDAIAEVTLNDRRGRMLVKSAARLLAKGQLTEQAHRNYGPLAGIAVNIFSAATETADTRGWTLLPRMFYVSRVRLSPGQHKVKIYTDGVLNDIKTVQIKQNRTQFFRMFRK